MYQPPQQYTPPAHPPAVKRSKAPIFISIGIAVVGIVVAIIIAASGRSGSNSPAPEPPKEVDVVIVTPTPDTSPVVLTPAQIYENNLHSVFQIFYFIDEYYVAWGSGFFISESGVAVTNHHVLDGTNNAIVILEDGSEYDITGYYSYDIDNDIAVIQVDGGGRRFQPVTIGNPDTLSVGDRVYAIGGPGGDPLTLTEGIISRFAHEPISYHIYTIAGMLQSTAFIYGGNSGGPLFNDKGHVIGINSAGMLERESTQWAVPVDRVEVPTAGATIHSLPIGTRTQTHFTGEIFGFERYPDIPDFLSVSNNAYLLLSGTAFDLDFDLVIDLDEDGFYSFEYAYLFDLPEEHFVTDTDLYDDVLQDHGFIFQDVIVDEELEEVYVFLYNPRTNMSLVYCYFVDDEALLILIGSGNLYEILAGIDFGSEADPSHIESGLLGRWTYSSGDLIYFFWIPDMILFEGSNVFIISDFNNDDMVNHGKWSVNGSRLTVTDSDGEYYEFTFEITGNTLSITDHDGDTGYFERIP